VAMPTTIGTDVRPHRFTTTEVVWRLAVMLGGFVACSLAALVPLGGTSLTDVLYVAASRYHGGGLTIVIASSPGAADAILAVVALLGLALSRPLVAYHTLALATDLAPGRRLLLARVASLTYVAGMGLAFAVAPLVVEAALGSRTVSLAADVDLTAKSMAIGGLLVEFVAVALLSERMGVGLSGDRDPDDRLSGRRYLNTRQISPS
jgi:hypothetical protein